MLHRATAALLLALAAAGASAQMYSPGYGTYGAPMSNFLSSSYLVQQVANGARSAGQGAKPKPVASTPRFTPSAQPVAPHELAKSYPPGRRDEAERFFARTLDGYRGIEAKFGLPRNDLAGAVAAFIAGNYVAWRDEPFPDENFPPLVMQMRGVIAGAVQGASNAERQRLYEELAILGTHMALTREALQQQPDAKLKAEMKRAAGRNLEQFLKVDPDRVVIGAQGLAVN
jgi:hypothetical protein